MPPLSKGAGAICCTRRHCKGGLDIESKPPLAFTVFCSGAKQGSQQTLVCWEEEKHMKHNYKTAFCSMRNMFGRSTSPTRKNAKFSSISQQSTSVSVCPACNIVEFVKAKQSCSLVAGLPRI